MAATSGEYRFGTFVRSLYNTEVDAALLGGTPARPQVYAPTIWVDGGTPSTPVARVKQVECALNAKVLTTTDAESGDTTPPPPRTDCRQPGLSGPVS
ncbi:hypothetical protein J2Z21_002754 [Streptomyces griseochromogenes]|uniref:Uncharacterized protein n=1 Tax=Streptomyces griseochromogenes TaxID=68214 RepID=A0A1B1AY18_9ACTN|nr:hypothetical protein [Streptomyces griseochromogenes]ANP51431.1 hypothetical protein AVL59_19085 [Streptomyces griseochromogenes]MBP2049818.1 hypothetical protein [Streptomyces griseochromogenes]